MIRIVPWLWEAGGVQLMTRRYLLGRRVHQARNHQHPNHGSVSWSDQRFRAWFVWDGCLDRVQSN